MSTVLHLLSVIAVLFLGSIQAEEYYGKLVGPLNTLAHDVSGTVYVVDSQRLRITNFNYDGAGPDAFFWVETVSDSTPTDAGIKIPDEHQRMTILGSYSNADITLTLPNSIPLSSVKWLSVWCRDFKADFGHVKFPASIVAPAPVTIGAFSTRAHGVSSGTVTVVDARTVRIENLHYDGQGPDAFFFIGKGTSVSSTGTKVPDENGSLEKAHRYTGQTVTLTLPEGHSVREENWLSIYCIQYSENFGEVFFPANLDVPPYIAAQVMAELGNCEKMHDHLNVAWDIQGDNIILELTGALDGDDGYMAFGLSASPTGSIMFGADAVVAYYKDDQPVAEDYYLEQYALCSGGAGVCPDTSFGAEDNLQLIWSRRIDGISTIRVSRKLDTGEAVKDLVYPTDRAAYIVWSMGRLNDVYAVTKHSLRLEGNKNINFGRTTAARNCPDVKAREKVTVTPWQANTLVANDSRVIVARLGPTGGNKGYSAITGHQSWGIAWYLDGLLIPELWVQRGLTYTFLVQGGNDTSNTAEYHPLYIAGDARGGYKGKTFTNNPEIKVYAGIKPDGQPTAEAVGPLCEYTGVPSDADNSNSFDEFFEKLNLTCANTDVGGMLQWTPASDTPDLIYYQCWTHNYLGWKIHVVDDINNINGATHLSASASGMLLLMMMIMLLHHIAME